MKAELDENGVLSIIPETPTEQYALKKWSTDAMVLMRDDRLHENQFIRGSMILVSRQS